MAGTVLFKNARLIDGIADQPRSGASFVVKGDRIEAVGDSSLPAPAGATTIDLKGQTVLPGLIDTHVHATFIDHECLPLFLAAGVTTVRDVGAKLEKVLKLRADLNGGSLLGPRLFCLGPLLDGSDHSFPHGSEGSLGEMLDNIPSPDAAPAKISELLNAGVDGIKLYFTMPPETMKAVIGYVDKRVPVTGHLGYTHSLDAIKAGIDGLEHVWISPYNEFCALNMQFGAGASMMDQNFWVRLTKGWEEADLNSENARGWFGAMVERQVNMGTTLDLLWIAKFGAEAAQRDPERRLIPPAALKRQRAMAAHMGERPDWDIQPGLFEPANCVKALEKHQEVTRILHESGGLVVGGTDCGGLSYPPPGFALLREVELMAEAIGAMDAIKAVTAVAARYLRQDQNLGTIAPGRYADFSVVEGDPLRDLNELHRIKTVYRGGVACQKETLIAQVPKSDVPIPA
ncbi:MAG TPA: amidohydrolase family protein [Candidatus Binataceae bacterium]|nr:amidohydrolase family protein [Candidatus Binataceae bacterium]